MHSLSLFFLHTCICATIHCMRWLERKVTLFQVGWSYLVLLVVVDGSNAHTIHAHLVVPPTTLNQIIPLEIRSPLSLAISCSAWVQKCMGAQKKGRGSALACLWPYSKRTDLILRYGWYQFIWFWLGKACLIVFLYYHFLMEALQCSLFPCVAQ